VPLASEVAAIWIEGSELLGQFQNSVVLHGKDRSINGIRSYHGCYDALSYPLFFPRGELGWHMDIPKKGVSMDEVITYCALLKAHSGSEEETGLLVFLFNTLNIAQCLFTNNSYGYSFCRFPWETMCICS